MNNFKRKALETASRLGLINSHRILVLAISEERQVYETILKLVLAQVNASTSFLRWAKMEQNESLKYSVGQLYDISLMYSSVQRDFAEKSNFVSKALQDILACEVALQQLQKKLRDATERKERLQKESDGAKRKSNTGEDISKLEKEEESLKTELDTKTEQTEKFKCTSLKTSLSAVCDANLQYAEKISLVFTAMQKIVNNIPDDIDPQETQQETANDGGDVLVELSQALGINRPMSSKMPAPSSKFHVELGGSRKEQMKKTISNPVLLSPPSRPTRSIERDESKNENDDMRRRSNTNFPLVSNKYDLVEYSGGQIFPLHRSSSDSTISTKASDGEYGYCQPWENFQADQEALKALGDEIGNQSDLKASEPDKDESFYEDPAAMFNQGLYESKEQYPKYNVYDVAHQGEEQIYSQPTDQDNIRISSRTLPTGGLKSIYGNTADGYIVENAEYMDNNLIKEPIKSKLDFLENIILSQKSPLPSPKAKPKSDDGRKLSSMSMKLPADQGPKKIAPKPKPRPNTTVYENASSLKNVPADDLDHIPLSKGVGSVRELAAQMSGRIQPASLIPSMTQARLDEQENDDIYENVQTYK